MINERVYDKTGLATLSTIDAFFEAENKPYLADHTKPLCDAPPCPLAWAVGPLGLGPWVPIPSQPVGAHPHHAYVDQKPC